MNPGNVEYDSLQQGTYEDKRPMISLIYGCEPPCHAKVQFGRPCLVDHIQKGGKNPTCDKDNSKNPGLGSVRQFIYEDKFPVINLTCDGGTLCHANVQFGRPCIAGHHHDYASNVYGKIAPKNNWPAFPGYESGAILQDP